MWIVPVLHLLSAALIALLGPRLLRKHSHWPCILAAGASCGLSIALLYDLVQGVHIPAETWVWFEAGGVRASFSLGLDGLTALMLVMVTFIGTLIAIYSAGYMDGDPGYPRFFAAVSLFLASMTGLVLARDFLLLYACWEGVGLCSYLLIGFWFQRPSAAAAARKAFLVTRIGDVGLFLGILLFWLHAHSLEYAVVFSSAATSGHDWPMLAICLLLFCGAVGKSAQFPLHVWLPDAMEGPSPVSALIHAATMVTAGVYLVARCTPLFALAPDAQLIVACIGAFTALLAALIALTQTDLKRVLAYSTVSQLGYMFLALGCARTDAHLVSLGVTAAIFHLFTHAFFKALLFLSAGSVMHAMGNVIDMRKFSGLRRVLPHTHWTFLCGAAALAGVPLLSGFWSKDEILAAALEAHHAHGMGAWLYPVLFMSGLITAALTAFYTFRAYFKTFWGELKLPPEAGQHGHGHDEAHGHEHHPPQAEAAPHGAPDHSKLESPWVMLLPLMILAVGAVGVGIVLGPNHLFGWVLKHDWMEKAFPALLHGERDHGMNIVLMLGSSVFALGGVGLAWWMYLKQPELPGKLAERVRAGYEMSRQKFYLDEIYNIAIVKPLEGLSHLCGLFDTYVVDQLVDLVGQVPVFLGKLFSPIQNGLVQFYGLLMVLALAGLLISVLLR